MEEFTFLRNMEVEKVHLHLYIKPIKQYLFNDEKQNIISYIAIIPCVQSCKHNVSQKKAPL